MKKNFRGMTLAALLLSASASAQADNNQYVPANDSPQAFVGDVASDAPVHVGSPFAAPVAPISNYAPVTVGDLQPAGFFDGGLKRAIGGCDSCDSPGCDGVGCDSMCGSKGGGGLAGLLNLCGKDGWMRAEAMLMFHAERQAPPLVTSAAPGVFPVLPAATVEFGDDLDGGLSGGIRTDVGRYLTDSFGIGGRTLWIGENGDDYSASGDQTDATARSLGRPYYFVPRFNPGTAQEDSVIISQQNLFSGNVQAEYATDLFMADGYARMTFCHNKSSRLEFIAGYTYAELDDMISISSFRSDTNAGTNPNLAGTAFSSLFDTENRFNGGQLGFESMVARGRWTARALTKVHLGNMEQTVRKVGTTTDFLANAAISTQNSSVLINDEQGTQTQDVFTFIPEMDFTIGYRFRDHVSFTVGYTFLYFDNVAMAGDQINRNRDTGNIGANVTPVAYDIVEGSHWVQGISLGASIDY
ncbi:MAG: BBP7 family outer membrane beta-barrel protein [Phycisphaera sp. RhM]|nr:BBP7 family outer membrane beta-barrel protein [Phycisphaera sp. RhM]